MSGGLNTKLERWILNLVPRRVREDAQAVSLKRLPQYFFFQRVLGINAHVPWPAHWSAVVIAPEKVVLESRVVAPGAMPGQYIQAQNGIRIGANTLLAPGVKLISAHPDPQDYERILPAEPIEIGKNCWLAANVIVLPGVKLGDHTVAAAGAVVADSFPDGNVLLGGSPARVLKQLEPYGSNPKE